MSEIALAICILSLVAILGLWIGSWKIKGVGLGIGGVLFGQQQKYISEESHTELSLERRELHQQSRS